MRVVLERSTVSRGGTGKNWHVNTFTYMRVGILLKYREYFDRLVVGQG